MNRIKEHRSQSFILYSQNKQLVAILILLLITDIAIFLDIPILRPILGFLCFTILPGAAILHILKLGRLGLLKRILLSVGISLSCMMFLGLAINALYPLIGISQPLSTESLTISFTLITIILYIIGYKRDKENFCLPEVAKIRGDVNQGLLSPLIFPLLFPLLSVLGTHLMNTSGNNIILMVMLFLIPVYVVSLAFLSNRISSITYPIAIFCIAISVLLMLGLTSHYLIGMDVHAEFNTFKAVADKRIWWLATYLDTFLLSISMLPTVLWSFLGINKLYIYKLIYQLIWGLTPVAVYVMISKYIGRLYAFLASFCIISQTFFIYTAQSVMRQEIAILFFVLAIMIVFDDEIHELGKRLLFIVFMFSVVVSHYTTVYVFFALILLVWLLASLMKSYITIRNIRGISIILCASMIFLWYSQLTGPTFNTGISVFRNTFNTLFDLFIKEAAAEVSPGVAALYGEGVTKVPHYISIVLNDTIFALIAIGTISSILRYKKTEFNKEYLLMLLVAGGLLFLCFISPYLQRTYEANRLYMQLLPILIPSMIIGAQTIIKKKHLCLIFIVIVVIGQFLSTVCVTDQLLGIPASVALNRYGDAYETYYILDAEVAAATWLNEHGRDNTIIHSDSFCRVRLAQGFKRGYTLHSFAKNKAVEEDYIYLRHTNVVNDKVYIKEEQEAMIKSIKEYKHLFVGKSKIYDNEGAEIYE